MDNPVVLITGALTGIGRAAAVAFARNGATVVVAGRRDEAGTRSARSPTRPRKPTPRHLTRMFSA